MLVALFTVAILIGLSTGEDCIPDECSLPDCRCYTDTTAPGGLSVDEIPQMVIITMDYALNVDFGELYQSVFVSTNPNNCPVTGTFFIQDQNTNYALVKEFYDNRFEIGINSLTGARPADPEAWTDAMKVIKDKLIETGLAEEDIVGYRAPSLSPGGSDMFLGIADQNLLYDCSCVTNAAEIWPFTYDYDFGKVACNSGQTVNLEFEGKWQVLLPVLTFGEQPCATPQSCPGVNDQQDAFDLLYNNFEKHYEGQRTPYTLVLDPVWMKTDFKLEGLKQFVEFIRAAFDDVWVVTQHQALQWVQNPTPIANLNDFEPFQCTQPRE